MDEPPVLVENQVINRHFELPHRSLFHLLQKEPVGHHKLGKAGLEHAYISAVCKVIF